MEKQSCYVLFVAKSATCFSLPPYPATRNSWQLFHSSSMVSAMQKYLPASPIHPGRSALRALADLPINPRPVVVIDEFTYLISGNKAIPSILQKVWDEKLKETSVMLVLCGSYIGMMETEVLGYQAPLYGRRTASTFLRPLGRVLQNQKQFCIIGRHEPMRLNERTMGAISTVIAAPKA